MKEISVYDSGIRFNDRKITDYLIAALEKHGFTIKHNAPHKIVAVWGWARGIDHRTLGRDVLVLERAYLGKRLEEWISLGWNGLNGRANFCIPKNPTIARFNKFFELKPWKTGGDKIIIMGQIAGDMSLSGINLTSWYEVVASVLQKEHGLPVFFRPHPKVSTIRQNFRPQIPVFEGTLEDALEQAALVVSYNSNTGVDAVINGVPSMSFDEGSMAWGVTSHDAKSIIRPDRTAWAARLAWCQMTPQELEAGEWVQRYFNRAI